MGWWPCCCLGPCDCACGSASYAWEFSPTPTKRSVFRYVGAGTGDTLLGTGPWTISFWLKQTCEVGIGSNGTVMSLWSDLTDGPQGTYVYELKISVLNNGADLNVQLLMRNPSGYQVVLCDAFSYAGCPYHTRTLPLADFSTGCVGVVVRWEQHPIQLASHLTIDNAEQGFAINNDDDVYDKEFSESFYPGQLTNPVVSFGSLHNDSTDSKAYTDALGACVSDLRIHHFRWSDTDVEEFIDNGTIPSGTAHHWQALNPWRQDTDDLVGSADLTYVPEGATDYSWVP